MLETATMGGGCYWCLEAYFQRLLGIESVTSGYSGGSVENPTSNRVYQGDTGHAEVVQVTFDPSIISYQELMEIFVVMHDPTTLNRQGADVGDLYRSIIFYHSAAQKETAESVLKDYAAPLYKGPIVTKIEEFKVFWPADETMQNFYNNNPNVGYCQIVIDPKIQKLRQQFAAKLK